MGYDGKNQRMVDGNKTINRVVDYFSFNCSHAVAELLNQSMQKYKYPNDSKDSNRFRFVNIILVEIEKYQWLFKGLK